MHLTREHLTTRLAQLVEAKQRHLEQAFACEGAIQEVNYWGAQLGAVEAATEAAVEAALVKASKRKPKGK